jgi:adenylate cyclase
MESQQEHTDMSFGPFRLDVRNEQLWHGHAVLRLTNKALSVLCYLVEHHGQLVTKDELFAAVWPGVVVGDSALVVCIRELRQALGDERRTPQFIETVHGRGYRFVGTVVSGQLSVVSQEEVVSSQHSVVSREEEGQKANGKDQRAKMEAAETDTKEIEDKDAEPQTPDAGLLSQDVPSPSPRFWSHRVFLLPAAVLLIGTALTVHYLSRSTLSTQSSTLVPQSLTLNPQPLPLPDKPSIVILPFVNMSGDPNYELLADGIVEGMTTGLVKLPGLFIISRASAFTYKGKETKARDVSRELGVRYVVEGSVQKAVNDHIRVTAQLIDATTDQHVWAESYDRLAKDIFAVRDDITQKLVTHIAPRITQVEQALLERTYAGNLEAYNYFVRGSFSWQYGGDKEKNAEGRQLCQKAVEIDPTYAHAYVCIGLTYWHAWIFGWTQDPQVFEQVLNYGQKAVALDDSLSPAHELIGLYYVAKQEYERALPELQRSVELGPNWSSPYAALGMTLNATGRAAEAIPLLEQAVRLNPRHRLWAASYLGTLGNAYRLTSQYDKAIEILKKAMSIHPFGGGTLALISTYSEAGHNDKAKALAEQVLQKNPQFSLATFRKRFFFFYKDSADMERFLDGLRMAGLK